MEGFQGCWEQEGLNLQELYVLDTLPGAANQIGFTVLSCELGAGHCGPHLVLARCMVRERGGFSGSPASVTSGSTCAQRGSDAARVHGVGRAE
jgi:hypothetical protein